MLGNVGLDKDCGVGYYVTLGIMTLGIVLLGVMTYNPFKNEQISIMATFTMPKSNGNKDQTCLSLTFSSNCQHYSHEGFPYEYFETDL